MASEPSAAAPAASAARLFDPARHEPLTTLPWDASAARDAIARIVADAVAAFEGDRGWPTHLLDEPGAPDERFCMLYMGAGGVIWALQQLAALGVARVPFDFRPHLPALVTRNRETPFVMADGVASYLMGDTGLLLLQWKTERSPVLADRLFAAIEGNLQHPTHEALWGSPGSLVAAIHMAEATGEPRWAALLERGVRTLQAQRLFDESRGVWLWEQPMYGQVARYIGAGHGFAGNVYPALRGRSLLPADLVGEVMAGALDTLRALAVHDDSGYVNWPAFVYPERPGRVPLVQDCHGAPGIVCRLAAAPRQPEWDALLLGAAELTWRAGPLIKGPNLCHGTAGNGYALIKLWRRSGDVVWLERARAFAMHAIGQVEQARAAHGAGRYSLWTGDLGVALYLRACIAGADDFPTLDGF